MWSSNEIFLNLTADLDIAKNLKHFFFMSQLLVLDFKCLQILNSILNLKYDGQEMQ